MRADNDLGRHALRNEQALQAWRERLEFYHWHRRQTGHRYVFPLPISGGKPKRRIRAWLRNVAAGGLFSMSRGSSSGSCCTD